MSAAAHDIPATPFWLGPDAERLTDTDAEQRYPELFREMAELAADELHRARPELPAADSRRLGARVAARLAWELGGVRFYWPKTDALERCIKELRIAAEYDGTTNGPHGTLALARRYRVSEDYLRRLLASERQRRRARSEA